MEHSMKATAHILLQASFSYVSKLKPTNNYAFNAKRNNANIILCIFKNSIYFFAYEPFSAPCIEWLEKKKQQQKQWIHK